MLQNQCLYWKHKLELNYNITYGTIVIPLISSSLGCFEIKHIFSIELFLQFISVLL